MNILITGGAGFIGSNLADRLLDSDNNIFVIDNFSDNYSRKIKENNIHHNLNKKNYKFFLGDICDKEFLDKIFKQQKIDIVIHLAALPGVRVSIKNVNKYVKTNIEGTINILETMKDNNIKKIIFASSSSVYGDSQADSFDECLDISKPISPYACTKASCEIFIHNYTKLFGIKAVILRLFTVYGPRQRPDLAICKFINLIENDKEIQIYGDGSTVRSYTYISDVVDGFVRAINYDKTDYEVINIGGNEVITLNQLVNEIENILGKKAKKVNVPLQIGDVKKTICSLTKASSTIGYQPKISFKDGLKKYIEWYNTNIYTNE